MKALVEWLRALGPLGVFTLAAMDSAGIPLVGGVDALLIYVTMTNRGAAYTSAGMAVIGSLIGSLILLFIGRKGGEAYLKKYTSSRRGALFRAWFQEYGLLTVFIPALVPIIPLPLKVFVLCAGAMEVSPLVFSLVVIVARIAHYFFVAWLALHLGPDTLPYLRAHLWYLLGLAAGLFVVLYLLILFVDRRRKLRKLVTDSE